MKHDQSHELLLEKNNLLKTLKPADKALLVPYIQPYALHAGDVVYEAGDDVHHAIFPCNEALISFMVMLEDARAVETALIGREGAVGGIVSKGHLPAYCRAEVRMPGIGIKITSKNLERAKEQSASIASLFSRYADCLISQIFQAVACNATHTIEQRVSKWILASTARTNDLVIAIRQEELANMLGVGRSYIARVMAGFKSNRSVETARGRLIIKDIDLIRQMSCNCDDLVFRHFETVLHGVYPSKNKS
ncbi:Crp/Fnr family transcriptional regulator [Kordiimonas sp.]|uniref:Crp/Fnr family transcriptional regulator n=1 Tax=Kordiimonas sp. TaxID=1970157 RepID=UPI003A921BBB